jgi:hypothetical protein
MLYTSSREVAGQFGDQVVWIRVRGTCSLRKLTGYDGVMDPMKKPTFCLFQTILCFKVLAPVSETFLLLVKQFLSSRTSIKLTN